MALTKVRAGGYATGGIIQIQHTQFTGTASPSITNATDTALTDLTVSITPTATSSKILLQAHVFFEGSTSDYNWSWMFFRDSTVLKAPTGGSGQTSVISSSCISFYADDNSSTPSTAVYQYFDTPSTTSSVTYKVGVVTTGGNSTLHINKSLTDSGSGGYARGISYISATAIAG